MGLLGRLGQGGRRIFELGRRRGYGLDHRADRRFEPISKPVHVRFALLRGKLILLHLGFRFIARLLLGLDLEGFDRPRHVAHFVLAVEPGQDDGEIAFCEFTHRCRQRRQRPQDSRERSRS